MLNNEFKIICNWLTSMGDFLLLCLVLFFFIGALPFASIFEWSVKQIKEIFADMKKICFGLLIYNDASIVSHAYSSLYTILLQKGLFLCIERMILSIVLRPF